VLASIGHRTPCFAYGEPIAEPAWLENAGEYVQQIWEARRQVSVSTDQYFRWLYRAVWDCDVTMSGSYRTDPDGNGIRTETTHLSLTKVGAVQTGRENKMPQYNSDGTTTLVADPFFNTQPDVYGSLPGDWLVLQRHNPCLPSNTVAVYFDARYRRTGQLIGVTGLNDPAITFWAGAPANVSAVAITSVVQDQTRYFYAAYTVTYPLDRALQINPVGTEIVATHYDPASRQIWPWLTFGGSPAAVNWHGYTPKDSAQPAAYPTTTALEVDGVAIPAGTSWSQYGTFGQLNISVNWKIARERDL
jgi:hypothetical protein